MLATEWCRAFHASKNALGMLRDLLLRGRAGPPAAAFRRAALTVLVSVKVLHPTRPSLFLSLSSKLSHRHSLSSPLHSLSLFFLTHPPLQLSRLPLSNPHPSLCHLLPFDAFYIRCICVSSRAPLFIKRPSPPLPLFLPLTGACGRALNPPGVRGR